MPPPPDVDEIWHAHILNTRRYAEDCSRLFGTFHHHYPYFGIDGKDSAMDMDEIMESFGPVAKIYQEEFGEPLMIPPSGVEGSGSAS